MSEGLLPPFLGSVPCFPRLFRILGDCVVPQYLQVAENLLESFWRCPHVNSLAEIRSSLTWYNLIGDKDTSYHTAFSWLAADKTPIHSRILLSHPLRIRKVHTPRIHTITRFLSCVVIKSCFHNLYAFGLCQGTKAPRF